MANSAEITNNDKKNLSSLLMVKELGGDLDAAIFQARASMSKEDIADVLHEFEQWKKNRA